MTPPPCSPERTLEEDSDLFIAGWGGLSDTVWALGPSRDQKATLMETGMDGEGVCVSTPAPGPPPGPERPAASSQDGGPLRAGQRAGAGLPSGALRDDRVQQGQVLGSLHGQRARTVVQDQLGHAGEGAAVLPQHHLVLSGPCELQMQEALAAPGGQGAKVALSSPDPPHSPLSPKPPLTVGKAGAGSPDTSGKPGLVPSGQPPPQAGWPWQACPCER